MAFSQNPMLYTSLICLSASNCVVSVLEHRKMYLGMGWTLIHKFDGEEKRKLLKHLPSCLAERDALHPNSK